MAGNATIYTAMVISIADHAKTVTKEEFSSLETAKNWINSQPDVKHSRITTGKTWADFGSKHAHKSHAYQAHLDSKGGK